MLVIDQFCICDTFQRYCNEKLHYLILLVETEEMQEISEQNRHLYQSYIQLCYVQISVKASQVQAKLN